MKPNMTLSLGRCLPHPRVPGISWRTFPAKRSSRGKSPRYLTERTQQIKETKRLRVRKVEIIEQSKRDIKRGLCKMFKQKKERKKNIQTRTMDYENARTYQRSKF